MPFTPFSMARQVPQPWRGEAAVPVTQQSVPEVDARSVRPPFAAVAVPAATPEGAVPTVKPLLTKAAAIVNKINPAPPPHHHVQRLARVRLPPTSISGAIWRQAQCHVDLLVDSDSRHQRNSDSACLPSTPSSVAWR